MTESIPRWRQDTRKWLSDDRLEAGDATVFFQPSFSHDNKIILVTGGVGPLEKRKLVKVPLQLGFWLETRGRGITHPPEWLNDVALKKLAEEEKKHMDQFQRIDDNFLEIGTRFFQQSKWFEMFPSRSVLQAYNAVVEIRRHKCTEGMRVLDDGVDHLDCSNLTPREITLYRGRACAALDYFYGLVENKDSRKSSANDKKSDASSTGGGASKNDTSKHNTSTSDINTGDGASLNNRSTTTSAGGGTSSSGAQQNRRTSVTLTKISDLLTAGIGRNFPDSNA